MVLSYIVIVAVLFVLLEFQISEDSTSRTKVVHAFEVNSRFAHHYSSYIPDKNNVVQHVRTTSFENGATMMQQTMSYWNRAHIRSFSVKGISRLRSTNSNNNDEDDNFVDDDLDTLKSFQDISKRLDEKIREEDKMKQQQTPKLGIEIGKMLEPLSTREAAELKAAATEIINEAYAEGLDEMNKLRTKMETELIKQNKISQLKSEYETQVASDKLMNKIDQITNEFLLSTKDSRENTKLAAIADQNQKNIGLEVGIWGTIDGAAVVTDSSRKLVVGSVTSALTQNMEEEQEETSDKMDPIKNSNSRIMIIADDNQDPYAKMMLPSVIEKLQAAVAGLEINVYKPTQTIPLGGDNTDCVVFFLTSLTNVSTLKTIMERLLRKTISSTNGVVQLPPSQFVAVSSIGTEQTNKMPYSMQNLLSGGKLENRRQMEEYIMNMVRKRDATTTITTSCALDYTVCKFGEMKTTSNTNFQLSPFDTFTDGTTEVDTASTILIQAMAFQPAARNSTLNCIGTIMKSTKNNNVIQNMLDDEFIKLDGPEIYRMDLDLSKPNQNIDNLYDELIQYIQEWANLLATNGKGLTTPVRAVFDTNSWKEGVSKQATLYQNIIFQQSSVQLLFLPTNTGRKYVSKEEEKERLNHQQQQSQQQVSSSSSSNNISNRKILQDGGIEIFIEKVRKNENGDDNNDTNQKIRLRVRRCNYSPDAVIKELSEETIISRFKNSIDIWKKIQLSK